MLEAPVRKMPNSVLVVEKGKPQLIQGWAGVENTQDEDWDNVSLSLIAGLPVSFTHDLYTPRYIRRPEVKVQETTGVLPPEVEAGILQQAIFGAVLDEEHEVEIEGTGVRKMALAKRRGAPAGAAAPMSMAAMHTS